MFTFLVFAILCAFSVRAQDQIEPENNNKTGCIEQFVRWCDNLDQRESGVSIMSFVYNDENSYNRVFCSSDSDGTNCTKNGSPWFECTPDHSLTYKGYPLTSDTAAEDVDDDICRSAYKAFDDLMLQNFAFNNETLREFQKQMDSFYEEMAALRQQMLELQARLMSNAPFFGSDFFDGFDRGMFYPAAGDASPDASSDESSDNSEESSNDSNQIEKE